MNRESNGIVLEVEKHQFHTPEENEINIIIQNTSNQEFTYGTYFKIKQNIDSIWYEFPFKNGVGFNDIGLTLKPYESKKESYSLDLFEEALSLGKYRVLISFIDSSKPYSEENKITLAVPFELTKK
ncbi:immunoglobulin-like domain-containing protein [Psychrobacillus sp. PGGUH221]|uniref:immunoglobulin-like domain-containing protein n=1 Tax=Psychrobacillus sp. PGGUH221 TaxID=3020058 RepID=UPI0035C73533